MSKARAVFDAMRILKDGEVCECGHMAGAHRQEPRKVPELPFEWTCTIAECDCLRPGPLVY